MNYLLEILKYVVILSSFIDLILTYFYVKKYKEWQPDKSFNQMERNIILLYFWKKFGFNGGMLIGGVLIIFLVGVLVIFTHWILWNIFLIVFILAIVNHSKNFKLLNKLIQEEK